MAMDKWFLVFPQKKLKNLANYPLVPRNMALSKNNSIPHYLSQGTIMSNYSFLGIFEVPEPGYTQFRVTIQVP